MIPASVHQSLDTVAALMTGDPPAPDRDEAGGSGGGQNALSASCSTANPSRRATLHEPMCREDYRGDPGSRDGRSDDRGRADGDRLGHMDMRLANVALMGPQWPPVGLYQGCCKHPMGGAQQSGCLAQDLQNRP